MRHYATLAQPAQPMTSGVTAPSCVVASTSPLVPPLPWGTYIGVAAAIGAVALFYRYYQVNHSGLHANPKKKNKKGSRSVTMTVTQNPPRKGKRRGKKGWRKPSESVSTKIRGTGNSPTRTSTSTSGKDIGNSPTRTSTKAVTLTSTQS